MKSTMRIKRNLPPIQREPTRSLKVKTVQGTAPQHLEVREAKPPIPLPLKKRPKPQAAIAASVQKKKDEKAARKAEVMRLFNAGMDLPRIAETTGFKLKTVYDYTRDARGAKKYGERYKHDAEIIRLYNEGLTYDQIADAVGLKRAHVGTILYRLRQSGKIERRISEWNVTRH